MLKDKVIIITGAAGGIGSATAHLFAKHGAILILTDIHKEGLEDLGALLKDSGVETMLIEHDVADPESWQSLMEKVRQKYSRVDILINNAGVVQPGAAEKISLDEVQNQLSVNLSGTIHGCRAALNIMKEQKIFWSMQKSALWIRSMKMMGMGMLSRRACFLIWLFIMMRRWI